MARKIPKAQKIYTTIYDNFKGVDFTNDSTNIWRRRSPTGTNMLPDASGKPFKRHGWEIMLSNEDICRALGRVNYDQVATVFVETTVDQGEYEAEPTRFYIYDSGSYVECTDEDPYDENATYYVNSYNEDPTQYYTEDGGVYTQCTVDDPYDENETYYTCTVLKTTINKCAYFELAGVDHIVIFTYDGVIFYGSDEVKAVNTDEDCYSGYDRCFFFEGNGTSAFYIYGNYKVWRYEEDFQLHDVSDNVTVPKVLVSTSADCVGTPLEGYNLLGKKACVTYNDVNLKVGWCSKHLSIDYSSVANVTEGNYYQWTYNNGWSATVGSVTLANSGIKVSGTPQDGDIIMFVYCKGVLLPKNVSSDQVSDGMVEVYKSTSSEFDYPVKVNYQLSPIPSGECSVYSDPLGMNSWVQFQTAPTELVAGEDFVKVVFPSVSVQITTYDSSTTLDINADNATLIGV